MGPAYQGPSLLTLVKYTQAILKALAHTHSRQVLHRGLTPDHILVCSMLQSMSVRRHLALFVARSPNIRTQVQAKQNTWMNLSFVLSASMSRDVEMMVLTACQQATYLFTAIAL